MDIETLIAAIAAKRAEYQAVANDLKPAEAYGFTSAIKELSNQLSDAVVEGAGPCPKSGNKPHGMIQYVAVKGEPFAYFEIGSLEVPEYRAQGFTREQAVKNWNDRKWIKPKA